MSWYPIAFLVPQYVNASGKPYSGAVLKAYSAETDTVIPIATTFQGTTTASSILLNALGFPTYNGAIIIPHIQENFKLALYPTQAAADADSGAIYTVDDIQIASGTNTPFVNYFDGDGTTTNFTLSQDLGSDESILEVFADRQLPEFSTNGTFASDTAWTKGTGWTIGAGVATATGAISTDLTQNSTLQILQGQAYVVTYTITDSAGTITAKLGGTSGTARSSAGTYIETIIAGSSQAITFTGTAFTGTVDNVSVKPTYGAQRQILRTDEYTLNGNGLALGEAPPKGTKNIIVYAPSLLLGAANNAAAAAATSEANALTYSNLSKDWANKITGDVDGTEYSAKAYASGGVGITNTSGKGAAKEWATTTGATVDTTEYSAKEYAQGTTVASGSSKDWASKTSAVVSTNYSAKEYAQGSQASTGGSAKNWSQQTGADVTGAATNSRSAKSWAQDVNTGATLGGSAKDWALTTGGTVDGTGYSSREHAIGTTVASGSSKDWASKTSAIVGSTDYSAKEFASGSQALTGGSAKNWSQQTGADVTGATSLSRSAKSWAQDNLAGGTYGGSAKDWAQSASLPDGTNKSAKSYATDSGSQATIATTQANLAVAAAAAAATAVSASANEWVFQTSTSMTDPGTGNFRGNNATLASMSQLAISALSADSGNPNLRTFINTWDDSNHSPRGLIRVEKDATHFAMFGVNGSITDNTTWLQIPVTVVASVGSFTAADITYVNFTPYGNDGLNGTGSGDFSTNTSSSVAGEIVLFTDTTGKSGKRATGTGYVKVTSGVFGTVTTIPESDLTFTDIINGNVSSTTHGFAPKSPADATKFMNGAATPIYAQVKDSDLSTSNVTTNNVSSVKHGFAPISPADATQFLNGAATNAYAQVKDSDLSTSNVTTNDATTAKHGFMPKGTGAANTFYCSDMTQKAISGGTDLTTITQYGGF